MSYRVTRDADQRPRIILEGEPPYCTALDVAPEARETKLDNGFWLVMAFAVWSVPDVLAIQTALDAAKRYDGKIKLGLRPFDEFEEFDTWIPTSGAGTSPSWFLLLEGRKCWEHLGLITVDDLVKRIEPHVRDRADVLN